MKGKLTIGTIDTSRLCTGRRQGRRDRGIAVKEMRLAEAADWTTSNGARAAEITIAYADLKDVKVYVPPARSPWLFCSRTRGDGPREGHPRYRRRAGACQTLHPTFN